MNDQTGALVQRAGSMLRRGHTQDVLSLLGQATVRAPGDPAVLRMTALALLQRNQLGPAIGALFLAVDAEPLHAATHGLLAKALLDDKQGEAALGHAEFAHRMEPTTGHATTLSCVLNEVGRPEQAIEVAQAALANAPHTLELLINLAVALDSAGRHAEAIECGRRAVAVMPGSGVARHNLAASLLAAGLLTDEAWQLYEGRFSLPGRQSLDTTEGVRWRGEAVAGRTVLLHAEQGLGDTIQFIRYVPALARLGARVVAIVQRELVPVLEDMPGLAEVRQVGQGLPAFDLYAPLLSLPGLLRTTLDTIPPPAAVRPPRPRARPRGAKLRVGLVWSGNPSFIVDRKRSVPKEVFGILAGIDGVEFHNLQFGASPPPELDAVDGMPAVRDFGDTASIVETLDLVIAVDTAVAHLAATLAVPTWLLTRHRGCWRWLHERTDTPWYPVMTIYRQQLRETWDAVLMRVRADLVAAAAARDAA